MKLAIGIMGAGAIEATQALPLGEIVHVAVQIIIGIATLIGLFRKPKNQ